MPTYIAKSRTNYFHVRNKRKFKEWAKRLNLEIMTDVDDPGAVALNTIYINNGTWPASNPKTHEEIDFVAQLASHLRPGQVAILMEAGYETVSGTFSHALYVAGYAIAVDHTGDSIQIALNDIYTMAREHFKLDAISCAEY